MRDHMGTPPWVHHQMQGPFAVVPVNFPLVTLRWLKRERTLPGFTEIFHFTFSFSSVSSSQTCPLSTTQSIVCRDDSYYWGSVWPLQVTLGGDGSGTGDLLLLRQSMKPPIALALWWFFIRGCRCFFWTLLLLFSSPLISILQVPAYLFSLASSLLPPTYPISLLVFEAWRPFPAQISLPTLWLLVGTCVLGNRGLTNRADVHFSSSYMKIHAFHFQ